MKHKSKRREQVYTIFFMFISSAIFISALTLVHLGTRETIKRNEAIALRRSLLYTAGIEVPKQPVEIEKMFTVRIRLVQDKNKKPAYYRVLSSTNSSQIIGYIFRVSGSGLWGEIEALVGLDRDLKQIIGIDFIKQSETPGLGARITERWFREQMRGKRGPKFSLDPEKTHSKDTGRFDTITGATITTESVKYIMEKILKQAPAIIAKSGGAQ